MLTLTRGEARDIPIEIHVFRSRARLPPTAERLWSAILAQPALGWIPAPDRAVSCRQPIHRGFPAGFQADAGPLGSRNTSRPGPGASISPDKSE